MNTVILRGRRAPFRTDTGAFGTDLDTLVRRAFGPIAVPPRRGFVPAAEVRRDGDDAVVRLELPGLDAAKDVTVDVEDGRLVVAGERRDERSGEGGLREVRYGSFRRSFALPGHVGADDVSASYDAGVLTVRVAGAHTGPQARRIAIATAAEARDGETGEERTADTPQA